jgi:hypothetical protein
MKKADLRTGMRVTTRSGRCFLVLLNIKHEYDKATDVLVGFGERSWYELKNFNDDLSNIYADDTIMKVEVPKHLYAITKVNGYDYEIIWERDSTKEMTIEEIQQALGYKIKVVENK